MSLEGTLSIGDERHPFKKLNDDDKYYMFECVAYYHIKEKGSTYSELKPILKEINEFYKTLVSNYQEDTLITQEVITINYRMDGRFAEIK